MNITPIIPDGYNGPIKQLTCHICKHLFYITQDDYRRLQEVRYCHECSLILLEELQHNQGAPTPSVLTATKRRQSTLYHHASLFSLHLLCAYLRRERLTGKR